MLRPWLLHRTCEKMKNAYNILVGLHERIYIIILKWVSREYSLRARTCRFQWLGLVNKGMDPPVSLEAGNVFTS